MVLDWVKFLRKQDINISIKIYEVIEQILSGNFDGLDIKPLKGRYGFYRCRIGNIRIVFINMKGSISVYKIGTRGDIYKGL